MCNNDERIPWTKTEPEIVLRGEAAELILKLVGFENLDVKNKKDRHKCGGD